MFGAARRVDPKAQLRAIDRSQAMISFALDGTILEANANFLDVMGYQVEAVIGRHHSMFVDPAEVDTPEYRAFWKRLGAGTFETAQYRRIAKGGREVWLRASYSPVLDGRGRPVRVVKVALDVTAQTLRDAAARGQIAAIERSQAVIQFDLDGTVRHANANFLDALGYSLDEVVGRHHSLFVDPVEADTSEYRAFWEKMRGGGYQDRKSVV